MQQFSKQKQLQADYGTRAMESGDHFKNEVSLKSQKSKGNLMSKIICSVMIAMTIVCFASCEKDGLTKDVRNLIPDEYLKEAKDIGLVIHEGKTPPSIEGEYKCRPTILDKSNFDDVAAPGREFSSAVLAFAKQNNTNLTVMAYIEESVSGAEGSDLGKLSFITGKSNKFTVYVPLEWRKYEEYTCDVVFYFSGEIENGGIKDFQMAAQMIDDHGDPTGELIENGSIRLFKDGDGLAERTGNTNLKSAQDETVFDNVGTWNFLQKVN